MKVVWLSLFSLMILESQGFRFLEAASDEEDQVKQYSLEVVNGCANTQFSVNFMESQIIIFNPWKLNNVTVQDAMEDSTMTYLDIQGQGGEQELVLSSLPCAKTLLLEVCTMEEQDTIEFQVALHSSVCYLDSTNPTQAQYENDALYCAQANYVNCKNNMISSCVFVDCLLSSPGASIPATYLFSICLPSAFGSSQIRDICREVGDGNDYQDYRDGERQVEGKYGLIDMSVWSVAVVVIASLLCCICSLSCFYNYRVFRTREPPFWVPGFCPDCLFPRRTLMGTLGDGGDYNLGEEGSLDEDSDPKIAVGGRTSYKETSPIMGGTMYQKGSAGTQVEMKQNTNRYVVPQFEDPDD